MGFGHRKGMSWLRLCCIENHVRTRSGIISEQHKSMKFSPQDTESLLTLLKWRRDVRQFKQTPLPDDAVSKLKEAMDLAPSVGNSRPWRVVQVNDNQLRERIVANHNTANEDAKNIYEEAKRQEYQKLKLEGLREAPLQLAIFTDPNPVSGHGLGRQTMPETLVYSTITAIHQLWLVARTLNIGVGWVSILEPEQINELLGVDQSWLFTAYLCIGYPENEDDTPKLHRDGWQLNEQSEWLQK